jgi:hypothetical protein
VSALPLKFLRKITVALLVWPAEPSLRKLWADAVT